MAKLSTQEALLTAHDGNGGSLMGEWTLGDVVNRPCRYAGSIECRARSADNLHAIYIDGQCRHNGVDVHTERRHRSVTIIRHDIRRAREGVIETT